MKKNIKNKIYGMLIVFFVCMASVVWVYAERAEESEQQEIDSIEPEPLVIESANWTPHGVFKGTIVISGEGIEDTGYEGIMYIELDGKKLRISCTDAVRSRYGELF